MFFALAAVAAVPAGATSNYEYKPGEYAIVEGGMAPDKQHSIAAHGDGEGGSDNFHIYLMAEPDHRKIGPLEEIKDILDTGPDAYAANWSKDSGFAAISYRSDRHIRAINIYRIGARRAYPIDGPLPREAAGIRTGENSGIEVRSSTIELTWLSPGRFRLAEEGVLKTTPEIAAKLGKYVSEHEKPATSTEGEVFLDYTAEAECEITGDKYKIVHLKP